MNKRLSLFEQVLYEADEDNSDQIVEQPDDPVEPPDINDDQITNDTPPNIPDIDMGVDGNDIIDNMGDENLNNDEEDDQNNLDLSEKISAIMNAKLYQRFLTLNNNVVNQISTIKNNHDTLYTISPNALDVLESLKKLEENIGSYLSLYFINNDYSKNLLFFNKCINLLKLLDESFAKDIKKGINTQTNNNN